MSDSIPAERYKEFFLKYGAVIYEGVRRTSGHTENPAGQTLCVLCKAGAAMGELGVFDLIKEAERETKFFDTRCATCDHPFERHEVVMSFSDRSDAIVHCACSVCPSEKRCLKYAPRKGIK